MKADIKLFYVVYIFKKVVHWTIILCMFINPKGNTDI